MEPWNSFRPFKGFIFYSQKENISLGQGREGWGFKAGPPHKGWITTGHLWKDLRLHWARKDWLVMMASKRIKRQTLEKEMMAQTQRGQCMIILCNLHLCPTNALGGSSFQNCQGFSPQISVLSDEVQSLSWKDVACTGNGHILGIARQVAMKTSLEDVLKSLHSRHSPDTSSTNPQYIKLYTVKLIKIIHLRKDCKSSHATPPRKWANSRWHATSRKAQRSQWANRDVVLKSGPKMTKKWLMDPKKIEVPKKKKSSSKP